MKADYWDVWSGIFGESFYGVQAEWCARNGLEYLVHLNHEELMLNLSRGEDLIRNEGDFFRDLRHVQIPGIDNLNQLSPAAVNGEDTTYAVTNNFPTLASSAAHLFGRPRVWTEGGGGTGVDGKFQLDYQLVRGVNAPQIRIPAIRGAGMSGEAPPQAAMLAWYTNRASYRLAIGRPALRLAPVPNVLGRSIYQTAPLIFALAVAYRWQITVKAAAALDRNHREWSELYPVETHVAR